MTLDNARMECVSNNGDLPSIENDQDLENVISNITATPASAANSTNTGLHNISSLLFLHSISQPYRPALGESDCLFSEIINWTG